jgi:hypothetical protein
MGKKTTVKPEVGDRKESGNWKQCGENEET